jgi:26S proteasome regulatory subunit N9
MNPSLDPSKSLAFLQSLKDRLPSPHAPAYADPSSSSYDPSQSYTAPPPPAAEAFALSLSSIAYAQLMMNDVETAKASLDECEGVLDGIGGVERGVMGGFYAVSADYWKVRLECGRSPSNTG